MPKSGPFRLHLLSFFVVAITVRKHQAGGNDKLNKSFAAAGVPENILTGNIKDKYNNNVADAYRDRIRALASVDEKDNQNIGTAQGLEHKQEDSASKAIQNPEDEKHLNSLVALSGESGGSTLPQGSQASSSIIQDLPSYVIPEPSSDEESDDNDDRPMSALHNHASTRESQWSGFSLSGLQSPSAGGFDTKRLWGFASKMADEMAGTVVLLLLVVSI